MTASCAGASITTSWAPTPFMRSYSPSPDALEIALDAERRELVGHDADEPARLVGLAAVGPERPDLVGRSRLLPRAEHAWSALRLPARCAGKSDGRRARSVEMMTQRPTTGSRRSSGKDARLLFRSRIAGEQVPRALGPPAFPGRVPPRPPRRSASAPRPCAPGGSRKRWCVRPRRSWASLLRPRRGFGPARSRGRGPGCGSASRCTSARDHRARRGR